MGNKSHKGWQATSTPYVAEYPDAPKDGYLSSLFGLTDIEFDVTSRIVPKNQGRARDELERMADELQADADLEKSVRGAYPQEKASEAVATYKAVENGQQVFDHGLVITVRADTRDELQQAVKKVRATLREQSVG